MPSRRAAGSPRSKGILSLIEPLYRCYEPVEWIRTGIPAIDLVIGAGIPRGRMIEVMGDPATAKSAFGYVAIGAFQRAGGQCLLLDSEAKTDREFAERMGVDWSKLGYSKASTIKECAQLIGRVARMADPKIPTLVVWDSLAGTPGAEELEGHIGNEEYTGEKAARARYLSSLLRATQNELSRKMVSFIVINQLRSKFNFRGQAYEESSGGKAPKYHAAVRLLMRTRGRIVHRERDVVTGIVVQVEAIKNTCAPPFRKATLRFYFDTGFAPYSGLDELLLRHGRITQRAGWLVYKDRRFRPGDLERIVSEIPELLLPLRGVAESEAATADLSSAPGDGSPAADEGKDA